MRVLPPLSIWAEWLEARQTELGITAEDFARARNSGRRRRPEKRELLRRIEERAREAGVEPIAANY